MNIVTCTACGSTQTRKPGRDCIKCNADLPVLAMEGKPVATDKENLSVDHIRDAAKKAYDKRERAKQAKVKPGTEEQLFTSTLKRKAEER